MADRRRSGSRNHGCPSGCYPSKADGRALEKYSPKMIGLRQVNSPWDTGISCTFFER
jgi:hypothetical protein